MVSEDTQITALFVVLGVGLWYASADVTDSTPLQIGVLLLVGLVVPVLLNQYRNRRSQVRE